MKQEIFSPMKFIMSEVVCLFAGFMGSVVTTPSIPVWYTGLNKPAFSPPNWIFMPVWTALYVLMGISLYIVWEKDVKGSSKNAISIFILQLLLNILWSAVFFGLHSVAAGLAVVILLWIAIYFTILNFLPISKAAANLLIPYILWVTFATLLNLSLLIMNL